MNSETGTSVPTTSVVVLVKLAALSAIGMALLLLAARVSGIDIDAAVADPQEVTRLRFLGIVSNVGVLMWGAAVSVSLFAFQLAPSNRWRSFFGASAVVALVLLVDDLLLVHEFADDVATTFIDFQVTRARKDILEALVFAVYGAGFAVYLFLYRDILRIAAGRRLLIAAVAMFALSAAFDFALFELVGLDLPDEEGPLNLEALAEEGPKFLGIVFFAAFYFSAARQAVAIPPGTAPNRPI